MVTSSIRKTNSVHNQTTCFQSILVQDEYEYIYSSTYSYCMYSTVDFGVYCQYEAWMCMQNEYMQISLFEFLKPPESPSSATLISSSSERLHIQDAARCRDAPATRQRARSDISVQLEMMQTQTGGVPHPAISPSLLPKGIREGSVRIYL